MTAGGEMASASLTLRIVNANDKVQNAQLAPVPALAKEDIHDTHAFVHSMVASARNSGDCLFIEQLAFFGKRR
jgi:hypothetical protein